MKRRGPRTKWQRIIRETVLEILIGAAIGLAFDAMLFDNPFLPQEFVEQLCKEYEGTIYYDRLILGLWKRAEGAIYKRFADNPEKFRCEVLEGPADNPEHKQFRKNDIVSIEIGLDFGGNQSGHSFVARGYTDDYRDVIGIMSKRVMAKDQEKDIDSNMLDQLFCDFVQEVIDKYSVIKKQGDYVEYCNVESVYYDNAETVLGNSIRNAVEKRFPWMIVRKAKKASIIDRIRCTIRLMGAGRFWITEDCKSLQTALSDAVWNKDVKDKDERLDDGSTDIDSLDAFEYRRIVKTGEITSTADWQINRLRILGHSSEDIEREIKKTLKRYKEVLGDYIGSLVNFGQMKYNDSEKWKIISEAYIDVKWQSQALKKKQIGEVHSIPYKGAPNSVFDNFKDGALQRRRYYGNDGRPRLDIDMTDHGNSKEHQIVPHYHNWYLDEKGNLKREAKHDNPLKLTLTWTVSIQKQLKSVINGICHTLI